MEIAVCVKLDPDKSASFNPEGEHYNLRVLEFIKRKPYHKGMVGNFCPHYCKYEHREWLIHGSVDYAYMHGYSGDAHIIVEE
jgi:hypothetical protein